MSARRPRVVAHRGSSYDEAEHTLAAYVAALEAGADGVECDVRLTADGHLVCVHDRDLRRIAGTRGVISTMSLEQLSELDVSAWKHPWAELDDEAPDFDLVDHGVLTLRRLMETVAGCGRRCEIAIETKHPTRYGGLVEKRLVELLAEFGWDAPDGPARVMSFSWTALQRVERLAPGLPLVQLFDKSKNWPVLSQAVGDRWALGAGVKMLRKHPKFARRLVRAGHEVDVWVVNTEADLELCCRLGVRSVITDRPGYLRGLLGSPAG